MTVHKVGTESSECHPRCLSGADGGACVGGSLRSSGHLAHGRGPLCGPQGFLLPPGLLSLYLPDVETEAKGRSPLGGQDDPVGEEVPPAASCPGRGSRCGLLIMSSPQPAREPLAVRPPCSFGARPSPQPPLSTWQAESPRRRQWGPQFPGRMESWAGLASWLRAGVTPGGSPDGAGRCPPLPVWLPQGQGSPEKGSSPALGPQPQGPGALRSRCWRRRRRRRNQRVRSRGSSSEFRSGGGAGREALATGDPRGHGRGRRADQEEQGPGAGCPPLTLGCSLPPECRPEAAPLGSCVPGLTFPRKVPPPSSLMCPRPGCLPPRRPPGLTMAPDSPARSPRGSWGHACAPAAARLYSAPRCPPSNASQCLQDAETPQCWGPWPVCGAPRATVSQREFWGHVPGTARRRDH